MARGYKRTSEIALLDNFASLDRQLGSSGHRLGTLRAIVRMKHRLILLQGGLASALAFGGRVGDISIAASLALSRGRRVALRLLYSSTTTAGASDVANLEVEALQETLGALRTGRNDGISSLTLGRYWTGRMRWKRGGTHVAPAEGRPSFSEMAAQLNFVPVEFSQTAESISMRRRPSAREMFSEWSFPAPLPSPAALGVAFGVPFATRFGFGVEMGVTTSNGDSWSLLLI